MNALTYADRPAALERVAYCDTSFILDLFAESRPAVLPSTSRARTRAALEFYVWARQKGVVFVTSFLAIEECYQKLLFSEVTLVRRKYGHDNWKKLRIEKPSEFQAALSRGRAAVATFQTFMRGSGIELIAFGSGRFAHLLPREPRICLYARRLLARYETDAMDAFHYALLRRCRISLAVSSDRDWKEFPYGTLVTAA